MIRGYIIVGTLSLVLFGYSKPKDSIDPPQGAAFDTQGCTGDALKGNLSFLQQILPMGLPSTQIITCDDGNDCDHRCDGGFGWRAFMVNRDRALLVETINESSWTEALVDQPHPGVSVTIKNICTQDVIAHGTFRNYEDSPYLYSDSAWVPARYVDNTQPIFNNVASLYMMQLSMQNQVPYLSFYQWMDDTNQTQQVDSFPLEALQSLPLNL